MTQVLGTATPAPEPVTPRGLTRTQKRRARVERVRRFSQNVGELFITVGVFVLLFCVYQLFWTNIEANRATDQVLADVRQSFVIPFTPTEAQPERLKVGSGEGFGLIYVPKLGEKWVKPLVEGATLANLKKGITHYEGNAMPGEVGNFAVAGHRTTWGAPFYKLDTLRPGDKVIVETGDQWVTYEVTRSQIVKPSNVWVVDPVPGKPAAQPTEALLTMTTCHPRFSAQQRYIVFGKMVGKLDKSEGRTPDALKGIV